MAFAFATCNRRSALQFIQKVYSDKNITDTPDSAGPLLDLVAQDICRVQDPMMHGDTIMVIAGHNCDNKPETIEAIQSACRLFA